MTRVVPFLRVADAEASAAWHARLGFGIGMREVELRDPHGNRLRPGTPVAA